MTEVGLALKGLRHDELTFPSVCLRTRCGLAQTAWSCYGLLGRGSRGAPRPITRAYERCIEHRSVTEGQSLPGALASRLNALGRLSVDTVLAVDFVYQLWFRDLPCPPCILQRAG